MSISLGRIEYTGLQKGSTPAWAETRLPDFSDATERWAHRGDIARTES
jgi:hypothetical protein